MLLLADVDILAELVDKDGVSSSLVRCAANVCTASVGRPAERCQGVRACATATEDGLVNHLVRGMLADRAFLAGSIVLVDVLVAGVLAAARLFKAMRDATRILGLGGARADLGIDLEVRILRQVVG